MKQEPGAASDTEGPAALGEWTAWVALACLGLALLLTAFTLVLGNPTRQAATSCLTMATLSLGVAAVVIGLWGWWRARFRVLWPLVVAVVALFYVAARLCAMWR